MIWHVWHDIDTCTLDADNKPTTCIIYSHFSSLISQATLHLSPPHPYLHVCSGVLFYFKCIVQIFVLLLYIYHFYTLHLVIIYLSYIFVVIHLSWAVMLWAITIFSRIKNFNLNPMSLLLYQWQKEFLYSLNRFFWELCVTKVITCIYVISELEMWNSHLSCGNVSLSCNRKHSINFLTF